MTSLTTQKNEQTDLLIGALDFAVFIAPRGTVTLPTSYAQSDGDLAALPAGLVHVGLMSKSKNPKLANSIDTTPVESYSKQSATRIIRKKRDVTVDFTMQETNIRSLGLWWGQDFTGTVQDPTSGETRLVISESAFNQEYAMVLIGSDGAPGNEIYTVIEGPRATLDKTGDLDLKDDNIYEYPATLRPLYDSTRKYTVTHTLLGKGWKGATATKAGFGPAVTGVTVNPTAVTLTAGQTRQLAVSDSNSMDVTGQATYVSSAPSKATVSAGGLVTAVASGSANITATYKTFTATTAVTVS